jgi:hypothetical protein
MLKVKDNNTQYALTFCLERGPSPDSPASRMVCDITHSCFLREGTEGGDRSSYLNGFSAGDHRTVWPADQEFEKTCLRVGGGSLAAVDGDLAHQLDQSGPELNSRFTAAARRVSYLSSRGEIQRSAAMSGSKSCASCPGYDSAASDQMRSENLPQIETRSMRSFGGIDD